MATEERNINESNNLNNNNNNIQKVIENDDVLLKKRKKTDEESTDGNVKDDTKGDDTNNSQKKKKKKKKKKLNIKKPIDDVEYQWKVADTFDAFKQRVSKQSKRFACIVFPDKILKLSKKKEDMESKKYLYTFMV